MTLHRSHHAPRNGTVIVELSIEHVRLGLLSDGCCGSIATRSPSYTSRR